MATMFNKGILGTKVGMTRIFHEDGRELPCTLVEAGPCVVTQVKTQATDGYDAIQIAFGTRKEKRTTKPMKGHFANAKTDPKRFLREVRLSGEYVESAPAVGESVTCEIFEEGDFIDVVATMKGRGYTGVVKRHNFSTLKESHGAHFFTRHAGSIGSRKPQHTLPGTRMAGQHGNTRVTTQNLKIARIDAEKNLLYIHGSVPGPNGGLVAIRSAKKKSK
ncbi:MAG: 50S ribosomal protein L3 [Planctomycetota bacterium]|nr:50S ribosomal protein L3 [Planctomycetota bacterium]